MALDIEMSSMDSNSVSAVFSEVWDSGTITRSERRELRTALLYGNLSSDDHAAIDRLIHAVKQGWLSLSE